VSHAHFPAKHPPPAMSDAPPSTRYGAPAELPRFPTIIRDAENLADAASSRADDDDPVGNDDEHGPAARLAPPPKFPSLLDVGLPSAKRAAAAAAAGPGIAAAASPGTPAAAAVVGRRSSSGGGGGGGGAPNTADKDHIAASIARSAVQPGTGERRAREAGEREWSDKDQENFDKLLHEKEQLDSSWIGRRAKLAPPVPVVVDPQQPGSRLDHDDDRNDQAGEEDTDSYEEEEEEDDDHLEEDDELVASRGASVHEIYDEPSSSADDERGGGAAAKYAKPAAASGAAAVAGAGALVGSAAAASRADDGVAHLPPAPAVTHAPSLSSAADKRRGLVKSADAPVHGVRTEQDVASGDASWIGGGVKLSKGESAAAAAAGIVGAAGVGAAAAHDDEEDNVPDWAKKSPIAPGASRSSSLSTPPVAGGEAVPEWVSKRSMNTGPTSLAEPVPSTTSGDEHVPEWVRNRPVATATSVPSPPSTSPLDDETPDWVRNRPLASTEAYEASPARASTEDHVPDWVKNRPVAAALPTEESARQADDEVPEWIRKRPSLVSSGSFTPAAESHSIGTPEALPVRSSAAEESPVRRHGGQGEGELDGDVTVATEDEKHDRKAAMTAAAATAGVVGAAGVYAGTRGSDRDLFGSEVGQSPERNSYSALEDNYARREKFSEETGERLSPPPKRMETTTLAETMPHAGKSPSSHVLTSGSSSRSASRTAARRSSGLLSVPMRSGAHVLAPQRPLVDDDDGPVDGDSEVVEQHKGMHAADKSIQGGAFVNVTSDFGLSGGHEIGVNDAAFLDAETLVTAGADGKVCYWDIDSRYVKSEFVPYDGESVAMLHVLPNEDTSSSATIMTLSSSRLMRIWHTTPDRAVLLRSMSIPSASNDLVMSVPVITPELKERAVAAAAAEAVSVSPSTGAPFDPVMDAMADEKVEEVPVASTTQPSSKTSPTSTKRNSGKFGLGAIFSRRKDQVPA
jgi:hypothetical protein